jgi:hypothetical protein
MWDPQRLSTLWAFTACYRDSFNVVFFLHNHQNPLESSCELGSLHHLYVFQLVSGPSILGWGLEVTLMWVKGKLCEKAICDAKTLINSYINGSTALCLALVSFSVSYFFFTQSVVLLGWVISPSQGRCLHIGQQKHKHPCLEWDSKSRSQRSSERRQFIP